MPRAQIRIGLSLFVFTLVGALTAGAGHAQPHDCSTSGPPGIGLAAGKSLTPYVSFASGTFGSVEGDGSILPRGGLHLGGRLDLPVAGPWRGRLEVSGANWPLEKRTYGTHLRAVGIETVGRVESRQIVALVGRQGGRSPACGYVLAGGGLYSLRIDAARVRRPGVALTAGIEVPVTDRGALQIDAQVHVIHTGARRPVSSSDALAGSISLGWLHRF